MSADVPVRDGMSAAVARQPSVLRSALRQPRVRTGLTVTLGVVFIAVAGPVLAPHSPTETLAIPFAASGDSLLLGADYLGRDVLSRTLNGGRSVVWMAISAAFIGVGSGVVLGLIAGYTKGWVDEVIMRCLDVVLSFPGLVLALLFVSLIGPQPWLIVLLVGCGWIPGVARVTRSMAADLATREFVTAAELAGASRRKILLREIGPNITMVTMVELGLRLTWSIGAIAGLSFLGLGIQPPLADWGLMMNENRNGLVIQPWPVVVPGLLIALLTIGNNLTTEGFARAVARIDER